MLTNQIASFHLLYLICSIYSFEYTYVKIWLLALANKEMLTVLFAIEEMDFLIYTFVYNTRQDYFARGYTFISSTPYFDVQLSIILIS